MTVAGMEKEKNRPYFGDISARPVPVTFYGLASELTQISCLAGREIRSVVYGSSKKRDSSGLPKGASPAAKWNPVGRHMQSRRPPYAIPSAAIWNSVGRQVPAGMNNRLSDDECWMLQYGDLHPHSSPNGREDLILSL